MRNKVEKAVNYVGRWKAFLFSSNLFFSALAGWIMDIGQVKKEPNQGIKGTGIGIYMAAFACAIAYSVVKNYQTQAIIERYKQNADETRRKIQPLLDSEQIDKETLHHKLPEAIQKERIITSNPDVNAFFGILAFIGALFWAILSGNNVADDKKLFWGFFIVLIGFIISHVVIAHNLAMNREVVMQEFQDLSATHEELHDLIIQKKQAEITRKESTIHQLNTELNRLKKSTREGASVRRTRSMSLQTK